MQTAILLMAYGGPDSLDNIEPYLLDIRGGRYTPPELVAEITERYARIGGRSPLLEITLAQADALEKRLNKIAGKNCFRCYVGMRHWQPYIRQAVEQIAADGITDVFAFCMTPHTSRMSTGAYQQKLQEAAPLLGENAKINFLDHWNTEPKFIQALFEKNRAALAQFSEQDREKVHFIFTAHSLPAAIIQQGDPYEGQLKETANHLVEQLGISPNRWTFCYQSAGAQNGRWLGPDLSQVLVDLANNGTKFVLVQTIGFVSDHVEILYDLDIEAQEIASENGIQLIRAASLNIDPIFIEALAYIVLSHLPSPEQR